mgnify:CR=1 FL=1
MADKEKVIVIDFGSQYTHLIAQKVRSLGVYSEVQHPEDYIVDDNVKGIILSGSPYSVYEEGAPKIDLDKLLRFRIPILGICYGLHLIAYELGGRVYRSERGEYGRTELLISSRHPLVEGIPRKSIVWMSHKDIVATVPDKFRVLGYTGGSKIAIIANDEQKIYGVQFHPEVEHTRYGVNFLRNFLFNICGCSGGWNPINVVNEFINAHKDLKKEKAIVAVSGGIDSTVTAIILRKIFGDNLHLIFIDTGLLRYGEKDWVVKLFKKLGFENLHVIDASERFLEALNGVRRPEVKRRIFSELFYKIFEEEADKLERKYGKIKYLGQGTLYPDRVESGATSRYTDRIKSHHNVIVRSKRFIILEPLKDLYKNEVRKIARALGLPKEVCIRHPFPGPGLAVRIIGNITRRRIEILRKADKIVEETIRKYELYEDLWQVFPVLLTLRSVGVKGDKRSYEYIIAIRAVKSVDAMTAEFAKLPWHILEEIANRILNEVEGVNRVLYDISNKPPATIEYE